MKLNSQKGVLEELKAACQYNNEFDQAHESKKTSRKTWGRRRTENLKKVKSESQLLSAFKCQNDDPESRENENGSSIFDESEKLDQIVSIPNASEDSDFQTGIKESILRKRGYKSPSRNHSHSRKKKGQYRILTESQKRFIVVSSLKQSINATAKEFNVSVNNICRWRKSCSRKSGAGRKISDLKMEFQLIQWIQRQEKGSVRKRDIQRQAINMCKTGNFKASKGWYERFIHRNKSIWNYLERSWGFIQKKIEQEISGFDEQSYNGMNMVKLEDDYEKHQDHWGFAIVKIPKEEFQSEEDAKVKIEKDSTSRNSRCMDHTQGTDGSVNAFQRENAENLRPRKDSAINMAMNFQIYQEKHEPRNEALQVLESHKIDKIQEIHQQDAMHDDDQASIMTISHMDDDDEPGERGIPFDLQRDCPTVQEHLYDVLWLSHSSNEIREQNSSKPEERE